MTETFCLLRVYEQDKIGKDIPSTKQKKTVQVEEEMLKYKRDILDVSEGGQVVGQ